jgi:hypothetical protein
VNAVFDADGQVRHNEDNISPRSPAQVNNADFVSPRYS